MCIPETRSRKPASGCDKDGDLLRLYTKGGRKDAGMAYVAILVLLAVISTLAFTLLFKAGTGMLATMTRGNSMQAHYLAESAANHAMWRLLNESDFPAAEDRYYMHSLAGGRYGYKVRGHTDTTFATVATVGAVGKNVVQQSYVLYIHEQVTYIADTDNHCIRKIDTEGNITTIAGTDGEGGYSEDEDGNPAIDAKLNKPRGLYVDGSGNIYIADTDNHCIRKVDTEGTITTIAGTGGEGGYFGDDGPATGAKLNKPHAIYMDSSGENIYIADTDNHRVRKVDTETGIITTIAGTGADDYSGDDGPATGAMLKKPRGLYVDGSGNIYIADTDNHCIRKIDTEGFITTIAGTGEERGYFGDDGLATLSKLNKPHAIYMDPSGENIYIADTDNHRIRKVDTEGDITTIAGTGVEGYSGDFGPAIDAKLNKPRGLYIDTFGKIYIADTDNHCIRKVDTEGIITTLVGTSVEFNKPHAIYMDPSGENIYIADTDNHCIRKVDAEGLITIIAGTFTEDGYSGDNGLATDAELKKPRGLYIDPSENIYIADTDNHCIRKVDAETGIITTVIGTGITLNKPSAIYMDPSGENIYIADTDNHCIQKVDAGGLITLIAGTLEEDGYSGDDGPATEAKLNKPKGLYIDGSGNIYIADTDNHCIRKVDAGTGFITTIAGTGGEGGYSGDDGLATLAKLNKPHAIYMDPSGENIYIADTDNHCVRMVDTEGDITTIAGTGVEGYSGNGEDATDAELNKPRGIYIDTSGDIYIADTDNHCIRMVDSKKGIITTVAGTDIELNKPHAVFR